MKTYVTSELIAKRLCIHCKHCETTYPTLEASNPRHNCTLKRSDVDNSPCYTAHEARLRRSICGGHYWQQGSNVAVYSTETEAKAAQKEDWIRSFISIAREHIRDGVVPRVTCGGYDEARRRVEAEMEVAA